MFNWRNRKKAEVADAWSIGKGTEGGKPLFIRCRKQPSVPFSLPSHRHLVSVVWQYDDTGNDGLPETAVNASMSEFEDRLEPLERGAIAYMMVIVTGNGRREWIWYATQAAAFMTALNELLSGTPRVPIDCQASHDPSWDTYNAFAQSF